MNIKNAMLGMLMTAGLAISLTAGASAAGLTAFAVSGGNTSVQNVTYTPGGGLTVTDVSAFLQGKAGQGYDGNVSIAFGPLANAAGYTLIGTNFDQPLAGSSFTITDNATSTVLLAGTFGSADLAGTVGSASGGVSLKANSVTYTGGTFFPASLDSNNGNLSLEFTAAADTASGTSGIQADESGVKAFKASDGITYSAPSLPTVPEPGTVTSFVFGGLGVLGLMIRARKSAARTA